MVVPVAGVLHERSTGGQARATGRVVDPLLGLEVLLREVVAPAADLERTGALVGHDRREAHVALAAGELGAELGERRHAQVGQPVGGAAPRGRRKSAAADHRGHREEEGQTYPSQAGHRRSSLADAPVAAGDESVPPS